MLDRTVGELVAERPSRSRIFQKNGIDFCCQGSRTLREACERNNVIAEGIVQSLEAESAENDSSPQNPADLPLPELIDHIVATHHNYLRGELPRLAAMSARVAQVHGGHTPTLIQVYHVFEALRQELSAHIQKEEQILFPAIKHLSQGQKGSLNIGGPIACMIHEHEDAGNALRQLRELSHDFLPPADACNTYRALFAGLQDLETDLHRHIHLENAVLFPSAESLFNEN